MQISCAKYAWNSAELHAKCAIPRNFAQFRAIMRNSAQIRANFAHEICTKNPSHESGRLKLWIVGWLWFSIQTLFCHYFFVFNDMNAIQNVWILNNYNFWSYLIKFLIFLFSYFFHWPWISQKSMILFSHFYQIIL